MIDKNSLMGLSEKFLLKRKMRARQWLAFVPVICALGCTSMPEASNTPSVSKIEAGFSPEAGAQDLVLKVIGSARQTIRLAGYVFTSPAIVQALLQAQRRGVDVRVLVDDNGNHAKANVAAINLLVNAGIETRTISVYAIHHDKYIVIDGQHTQTGSFNYSQAAAKSNSENVLVVWNNTQLAAKYMTHWQDRWNRGVAVKISY